MSDLIVPSSEELPDLPVGNGSEPPGPESFRETALTPHLRSLSLQELLALEIKPRGHLLKPVLPEKGLAMLYSPRGMGKTYMALAMAYAVASGSSVMQWAAPVPRPVLYIDGEMPLIALQERVRAIDEGTETKANPDNFHLLAADYFEAGGLPNLATKEGQRAIDALVADSALVVLDNLSTLASIGRDNDAESWTPVQDWLLSLRRRGISVLLVHHAGKGGQQRGTSRREDVLDTVIALKRPSDYKPTEGARFEVHLEKARGILGDDAKPFEARLETIGDKAIWSTLDLADANLNRVASLTADGLSIREIAEDTGISKSTVARLRKQAQGSGATTATG